jgi:hypothetical protein
VIPIDEELYESTMKLNAFSIGFRHPDIPVEITKKDRGLQKISGSFSGTILDLK